MVGIAYALFAIPSGIVAHRVGRKKTIRLSLAILVVLLAGVFLHDPITSGMSDALRQYTFWALLFWFWNILGVGSYQQLSHALADVYLPDSVYTLACTISSANSRLSLALRLQEPSLIYSDLEQYSSMVQPPC